MMDHLFDSEAHNYIVVVFHSDESEKKNFAFVGFVLDFRSFRLRLLRRFFGIVNNNKTPARKRKWKRKSC
jgi:hypothetical protein